MGNACQSGAGEEAEIVGVNSEGKDPTFEHRSAAKYARAVGRHNVKVMGNPDDYVYAFIPRGKHPLNTLVLYPDVQPIPAHCVVKDFVWLPAPKKGGQGMLTLPNFDGHVPTQLATPTFLAWFGCNFAEQSTEVLDFKVDHELMDFNYTHYKEKWILNPKYGPGSLGVERHEFKHLECPLEHMDTNGGILLGKINEEEKELYLSFIKIPQYHTMYIAPWAIHSNDHQLGVWRTMLSTFSEDQTAAGLNYIDHALMKTKAGQNIDLKFSRSIDPANYIDKEGVARTHDKVDVIENKLASVKALATRRVGDAKENVWDIQDKMTDEYQDLVKKLGHQHSSHTTVVKDESHSVEAEKKKQAAKK